VAYFLLLIEHGENFDKHTRKDELKADDEVAAMRPKIDTLANRYVAIIVPSVIDEASFGTREYW
jgi:hypothetical protein